jgi:hypothetical protein
MRRLYLSGFSAKAARPARNQQSPILLWAIPSGLTFPEDPKNFMFSVFGLQSYGFFQALMSIKFYTSGSLFR